MGDIGERKKDKEKEGKKNRMERTNEERMRRGRG